MKEKPLVESKEEKQSVKKEKSKKGAKPTLISLLKPYKNWTFALIGLSLFSNSLYLVLPKLIAHAIDAFSKKNLVMETVILEFVGTSILIFILMYSQGIIQTYLSEKVARDLRKKLAFKISYQSYPFIQQANPSKLLSNLTSDVDNIKLFVSQTIVSLVSSVLLIFGSSILLLLTNWKLALIVLTIIPVIAFTFFTILKRVRILFKKAREIIDRLNKVINENILGASIVRVLNVENKEYDKFMIASNDSKNLGMSILGHFAFLIPIIIFTSSLANLAILTFGGYGVINESMSLGDFSAFNGYLAILIFPILIIGFMSNIIAQANVAYQRIVNILEASENSDEGTFSHEIKGNLEVKDLTLKFGEKFALKDINFSVKAGTKTAIIGPTATGKTQLLYLLMGLIEPTNGTITYEGIELKNYKKEDLHNQMTLVFQDSIIFNMSLRENIAFNVKVSETDINRAIETAELTDFVDALPNKLETLVSERGLSLSGGQKQRIMLARALALNPKILLLDDFTARVDNVTEEKILGNIQKNYPEITIISVTQKISSVQNYEEIILLMEGELLSKGTHEELLQNSPEYVQIYNSQKSTNYYELHS